MLSAAARAAPARVLAKNRYVPAPARNVAVVIRGARRSSPPVVVLTPRSLWWQSTAESGGGLVCWLEALRALIGAPPACDVIFTAGSGHELGHLGLDDFMARRPGWERPISEGGATWVHFGANLGAADGNYTCNRQVTTCASLPRLNLAAPVRRRTRSLPRPSCPVVKPATSTGRRAEDTSRLSAATRCSIWRRIGGLTQSIRTR